MKIGLAGLGHSGRAIGRRLVGAGYRVVGYDPDVATAATSGLRTVESAARLHDECTIHLVAADGHEGCQLLEELLLMSPGASATMFIAGAISAEEAHAFALAAEGAGIDLVDAPIVGGIDAIEAGTAAVFAAGDEATVRRHQDILGLFGSVLYVGQAGSGQVARTVNDLVYWSNTLAIYEAFSVARACEDDVSRIREAVLQANGASVALRDWGRERAAEAAAETGAALDLARALQVDTPFLDRARELLNRVTQDQLSGLFNLGIADLRGPRVPASATAPIVPPGQPEG
ncbi:MAG: NAD(P)-dependent oxidoreductase, partial [Chloroflexota bacterium]